VVPEKKIHLADRYGTVQDPMLEFGKIIVALGIGNKMFKKNINSFFKKIP
jgi:hypothetical protein